MAVDERRQTSREGIRKASIVAALGILDDLFGPLVRVFTHAPGRPRRRMCGHDPRVLKTSPEAGSPRSESRPTGLHSSLSSPGAAVFALLVPLVFIHIRYQPTWTVE